MIEDLDETIRQLVSSEMPIKNGEIEVSFDQPKREWSSRLSKPTVNFFLYDLRENPVLRQHQWEDVPTKKPGDNQAHRKRSPFRIDCFYMLTTWANEPDDEHRLLSRCLSVLFRHPVLPEDRLIGLLKNQPYEIQARLASHDRLTNPAELWSAMDNEMRPSISYIVTLALDPWTEVTGPVVHSLTLRTGISRTIPLRQVLDQESLGNDMIFIGGSILKKGENGSAASTPLADIQVAIKGTGLFTTSNAQGQYALGSLVPGEYTLVGWLPDGKLIEKEITVPATGDNYDLLI
jgi:hypothetical protein